MPRRRGCSSSREPGADRGRYGANASFHVALDPSLSPGDAVAAGQRIGSHASDSTWDDLAIWVSVGQTSQRLVSAFDAMTDGAFAPFQARGATARSDFIIDKATRDANPLQCMGQAFTTFDTLPATAGACG